MGIDCGGRRRDRDRWSRFHSYGDLNRNKNIVGSRSRVRNVQPNGVWFGYLL